MVTHWLLRSRSFFTNQFFRLILQITTLHTYNDFVSVLWGPTQATLVLISKRAVISHAGLQPRAPLTWWLTDFTIEILHKSILFLEDYCAHCYSHFTNLAEVTMALNFWQDVANQCMSPNTNIILSEVMQQDKPLGKLPANIPEDTASDQPVWSSRSSWILVNNS